MDLATFLIQCLNAVQYGLLLFLVASGLTLIFGIMGVINLAHGSFYMIGAYMAFSLSGLTGSLLWAMVLGIALAAFAGMLAAPVSSVYPGMGNQVLIICFVVVVIGGIGSIRGALIAALLIGFAETFGQVFVPQLAGMMVYLLMALVLVLRPEGLFGRT